MDITINMIYSDICSVFILKDIFSQKAMRALASHECVGRDFIPVRFGKIQLSTNYLNFSETNN